MAQNDKQSKFHQLAEAVQHYLNGDYHKLLSKDEENAEESGDSILLESSNNAVIIDKIHEMQAKQSEKVCIVDTMDDLRPIQNVSPMGFGILSSQRVATVEE